MSMDPTQNALYVLDKLYEDDQVTLYTDFSWEFRQNARPPISRPAYIQDIISGKRSVHINRPKPQSPSVSPPPQTVPQRLASRRKDKSKYRMAHLRRRRQAKLTAICQQMESEMIAALPSRLQTLDDEFTELKKEESEWPPSELADPKKLYADFYTDIHNLARNIVCGSCGCIGHDERRYSKEPISSDLLDALKVDPALVPFNFRSQYAILNEKNIMVDDLGISRSATDELEISLCSSCHRGMAVDEKTPGDSLANYRWIGDVPEELQGLSWLEEDLISRAHLIGKIVRLQNRNVTSYFAIKGHVVLVPQDTRKLVDILPASPDSLLDSIRVVWVGKTEPAKLNLRRHFTVRTEKVRSALEWLCRNHADYREVQIDEEEIGRWPSVFVAEKLMNSMARVRRPAGEDALRDGFGVEDMDITGIEGDLPMPASALIDTNGVSESPVVSKLHELARLKANSEKIVNVVTGNELLSDYNTCYYFTAAFPTLFPYGSCRHIDSRRQTPLSLLRWIQLLLRHSSRRFQAHHAFVALSFDVTRRRHNSAKASLQTHSDLWETTEQALTSLTSKQLLASARQAQKHQKITDPGVLTLLGAINRIGATSKGSDEKKSHMLTQLKSSIVHYGCPIVFLTLNPADRHAPLALYYAGKEINLKTFDPELWSTSKRLEIMLDNPLAMVEYFHTTIKAIIEGPLKRGLFGKMSHYYGTIEYQGRGTPHTHLAIWIKGMTTAAEMREKAKNDDQYRDRLLRYVSHLVTETLPKNVSDDDAEAFGERTFGSRAFQPFPPTNDDTFEIKKQLDLYDLVFSRNMHSRSHTPTCFKYGYKKCRSKFPRALVEETKMDPETGLVQLKRDDAWMNGYNPWIILMLRANHDCKFLFSQIYALAIIHYVMKYISKPEQATHAKLTIGAAVRQELRTSPSSSGSQPTSIGKQMLSKVYNRLDSHREVGLPEAISHLCGFPDHYTSATFVNVNTKTLLHYLNRRHRQLSSQPDRADTHTGNEKSDDQSEVFDSEILSSHQGYQLLSTFDDYIHRGEHLSHLCLYDYYSLFYKERSRKGIQFDDLHPQASTHCQVLRQSSLPVPNILGRLLFLRPDCKKEQEKQDYYCLVGALFVPWSHHSPLNSTGAGSSWEDWYLNHSPPPSPRIARLIRNLELLHKTKDEVEFDRLQRASLDGEDDADLSDHEADDNLLDNDHNDEMEELNPEHSSSVDADYSPSKEEIEAALLDIDSGFYVQEALEAGCDYGYFDNSPGTKMAGLEMEMDEEALPGREELVFLDHLSSDQMESIFEETTARSEGLDSERNSRSGLRKPDVYLSWGSELEKEIQEMVEEFSLNEEQALAFSIVARQSCRRHQVSDNARSDSERQLLMGLFGEGGTGKSRVINAIRKWFQVRGMSDELLITATTGAAAVKIGGRTLHSAIGLRKDGKVNRVSKKVMDLWFNRHYLIIDEVSMMDTKLLGNLQTQLNKIKSDSDADFGGVNILFAGDFLQLPTVSHMDVYKSNHDDEIAHTAHLLWRKLSAIVILVQQMRQADDPQYASMLSRIRRRCPTDDDLDLLYSRIGVSLPSSVLSPLTIVRRNSLRHAINSERLQQMADINQHEIIYCISKMVAKSPDMSMNGVYHIRQNSKRKTEDAVLALIPGAPLIITQNIDSSLGLVNGAMVDFYGFVGRRESTSDDRIFYPPKYILVKLRDGPASNIVLPGLPQGVVPMEPIEFTYREGGRKFNRQGRWIKFSQFPVTLAYAITDYKAQGSTYREPILIDLKKPDKGGSSYASAYVQLSRATTLDHIFIMRPFNKDDLRAPLSQELREELEWQEEMAAFTRDRYTRTGALKERDMMDV